MELIFSNYSPAKITDKSLQETWNRLFKYADEVLIATGYISNDSIEDLHSLLEKNPQFIKNIQLLVGMHYLDGFTKLQYDSLVKLHNYLIANNRGTVYICEFMKFHGKLYSFKNNNKVESMIGSANFSCFWNSLERTYETMLYVSEDPVATSIYNDIKQAIKSLGTPITTAPVPTSFKVHNLHLDEHIGVDKLSPEQIKKIFKQPSQYNFEIPVKPENKSNVNAYLGKGRQDKRGFIIPRSWYEVELIVPNATTTLEGYPVLKSFYVITDDGWKFKCKTSGSFSKNFRSEDDLKVLGKWIKGRLELSGCLKTGQKITQDVLNAYGNNIINLRSTNDPDIWLLSFEGK